MRFGYMVCVYAATYWAVVQYRIYLTKKQQLYINNN